jgi:hypothetical protein
MQTKTFIERKLKHNVHNMEHNIKTLQGSCHIKDTNLWNEKNKDPNHQHKVFNQETKLEITKLI